jgi:hypothetical protein
MEAKEPILGWTNSFRLGQALTIIRSEALEVLWYFVANSSVQGHPRSNGCATSKAPGIPVKVHKTFPVAALPSGDPMFPGPFDFFGFRIDSRIAQGLGPRGLFRRGSAQGSGRPEQQFAA